MHTMFCSSEGLINQFRKKKKMEIKNKKKIVFLKKKCRKWGVNIQFDFFFQENLYSYEKLL